MQVLLPPVAHASVVKGSGVWCRIGDEERLRMHAEFNVFLSRIRGYGHLVVIIGMSLGTA